MGSPPENRNARRQPGVGGTGSAELKSKQQSDTEFPAAVQGDKLAARRQRQARHLHKCGPRCILEALLAVNAGEPLDAVLADFERLPPETYHAAIMAFCDEGPSWI